jgi:hypothetical protein
MPVLTYALKRKASKEMVQLLIRGGANVNAKTMVSYYYFIVNECSCQATVCDSKPLLHRMACHFSYSPSKEEQAKRW